MIGKTNLSSLLIPAFVLTTGLAFAQPNFQDVQPSGPDGSFYGIIQIAKGLGLAVPSSLGPCLSGTAPAGTNPPVVPPPGSTTSPGQPACLYFGPDAIITRAEAAYWIVKSVADEAQISNFLCATGGDPSGLTPSCNTGITSSTFGDLGVGGASIVDPFLGPNPALGIMGVTDPQLMRYIEVMARRGYTKGCGGTNDAVAQFCPNDPVNRAQIAVLIIRAKMDNVFPTSLSGVPSSSPYGDNFSVPPVPYFTDVLPTDPVWGSYYIYIQEMRELGITYGTSPTTFSPGNNITRKEMAAFAVRAFFL
jgi:hypothetical protein